MIKRPNPTHPAAAPSTGWAGRPLLFQDLGARKVVRRPDRPVQDMSIHMKSNNTSQARLVQLQRKLGCAVETTTGAEVGPHKARSAD